MNADLAERLIDIALDFRLRAVREPAEGDRLRLHEAAANYEALAWREHGWPESSVGTLSLGRAGRARTRSRREQRSRTPSRRS